MSVFGPLAAVVDTVQTGSSVLFFIGDSTVFGAGDGAFPGSAGGWPKRLGIAIGQYCGVTVTFRTYNASTYSYGADVVAYDAGSGSRHILIVNGGVNSQYIASLTNLINGYGLVDSAAATADCVFIGTGINDAYYGSTPATYVPNYLAFIDLLKSRCPAATICCTTQDVLSPTALASQSYYQYVPNYNALLTTLVGGALQMTPALQYSTAHDVWVLDTQQAYGNVWTSTYMLDNVHPQAVGYQQQADWMAAKLLTAPPAPVITTMSLGDMVRDVPFDLTLVATNSKDATWTVASGALPAGLHLADTGDITGAPTDFGLPYAVTIRVTNGNGLYDEQDYSGTVTRLTLPMIPTTEPRMKTLISGYYYPVATKIRVAGQFRIFVTRS